jgi:hypothetical protein
MCDNVALSCSHRTCLNLRGINILLVHSGLPLLDASEPLPCSVKEPAGPAPLPLGLC